MTHCYPVGEYTTTFCYPYLKIAIMVTSPQPPSITSNISGTWLAVNIIQRYSYYTHNDLFNLNDESTLTTNGRGLANGMIFPLVTSRCPWQHLGQFPLSLLPISIIFLWQWFSQGSSIKTFLLCYLLFSRLAAGGSGSAARKKENKVRQSAYF